MSEHICIVVSVRNYARFDHCRALRHAPRCKGADVALRFDRYLNGEQPLAFGYEALCDTANSCLACFTMARLAYAMYTTVPGDWMAAARDAYMRAACNITAMDALDLPMDEQDALLCARLMEAEAAWG